jgi:hypothetical protein
VPPPGRVRRCRSTRRASVTSGTRSER